MKLKMLLVGALLGWCTLAVAQAPPPFVGTWKLDLAKSKFDPGPPPKSWTQRNEAAEGGLRQLADWVDSEGRATHSEFTARFDGKDYPVTGSQGADAISVKKVDDRTIEWGMKKGGKVVSSGRTVYSQDGKSRTMTWTGTNAQGQKYSATAVFVKQ